MKTHLFPLPLALLTLASVAALFAAAPTPPAAPAAPVAEQPTVITSTRAKVVRGEKETVIIYDGTVIVAGTNLRILCDHLEVVLHRLGERADSLSVLDKFKSLVATGHVHVTQGDREASCGRVEVLPGEDKIVLTENPIVTYRDGPNTITNAGSRITFIRGKNELEIEQPRTTGPSLKDLGANPADLAPATAAPTATPPPPAPVPASP
jgi:lipopolysaccharide export system protein LptA